MTKRNGWRRGVNLPWWRSRDTVSDEIRHHLELRETALRDEGVAPDVARERARAEFGDIADAERYCEGQDAARGAAALRLTLLDELGRDVAFGWRQLRRHAGFSVGTIATLTMGLSLVVAALVVADVYLGRALPYPDAARLVQIRPAPTRAPLARFPDLRAVDWPAVEPIFDGTVAWDLDGFTLAGADSPEYVDGAWVSPDFFTTLGVRPARGRGFSPDEYHGSVRVAVISHRLWQRRFGGSDSVVGAAVPMFSTDRPGEPDLVTIVGVLPEAFWHVTRFTDVLRPLTTPRMPTLARLRAGSSIQDATTRLNAVVLPNVRGADSTWRMSLAHLQDEYVVEARPAILALLVGAGLTLLLAGANVAGLVVMRGNARRSEFAIRALLGAGRGRILRQVLIEASLMIGAATVLAVGFVHTALRAAGPSLERSLGLAIPGGIDALSVDWRTGAIATFLALATTLFVGWRAVRSSRPATVGAELRVPGGQSAPDGRMKRVLIGAQVAATVALLSGAGLMARTVWTMTRVPLGFEPHRVLKATVLLPAARFPDAGTRLRGTEAMLANISALPSIESAAAVWPHPFRPVGAAPAFVVPGPAGGGAGVDVRPVVVSPNYHDLIGIDAREGRAFDSRDTDTSEPVAIISAQLARRLRDDGRALGLRVRLGAADDTTAPLRTIVGIVGDARSGIVEEQPPEFYIPSAQSPRQYTSIVMRWRGEQPPDLARVQRAVASVDGGLALSDVEPMQAVVARETVRQRFLATLLGGFAVYALLLSALGLGSSLTFAVAQRRREIAVRLAVGAAPRKIVGIVAREAAITAGLGFVAGIALSTALTRLIATQLYGISAGDPLTYVLIAALVGVVTFTATLIPARIAAGVEPAQALRG